MDQFIFKVTSDKLPDDARAIAVVGREAISEIYQLAVYISTSAFDADDALRAPISLEIATHDDQSYVIRGIMTEVELIHQWSEGFYYRIIIAPRLWQLSQTLHSRVYTDNTIIEIIEAVLKNGGLGGSDFEFKTMATYETYEHVCQYKESDLDFILRWMAKEGLYFFFDHTGDTEKLIITDDNSMHTSLTVGDVLYSPGEREAPQRVHSFSARHRIMPANTRLKDYNYLNPSMQLSGETPISSSGRGEISLFGENAMTGGTISRYSEVRAQEVAVEHKVFKGKGRVFRLRPNHLFTLEGHANATYNDKSYRIVAIEHHGLDADDDIVSLLGLEPGSSHGYQVHFIAIPEEVQYRAPRAIPWPRIDGYEFATICGSASSEYAQLDDHGRYHCRIFFDESDLVDGSATTWIRMMQPHAGGIEGFHFPLRKGTEVAIFFLGGDPDRPMIAGAVPNPTTPSPVTSGNHTRNVIQTGGRNRLELEDLEGAQRITMSTPYANSYLRMGSPNDEHEVILRTDENSLLDFGANYDLHVGSLGAGTWDIDVKDNVQMDIESGYYQFQVHAGHWKGEVKQNIDIISNSGDIKIDAEAENIYVDAEKDVATTAKVNISTKAAEGYLYMEAEAGKSSLIGKTDVDVKALDGDMLIDAESGKLNIHGSTGVELTSTGAGIKIQATAAPWYNYSVGDYFKFKISSGVSLTLGLSSSTTIGLTNSNYIGGRINLTAAADLNATAALKAEIAFALAISATFGASITFNNAAAVTITSAARAELTGAAKMELMPTRMANTVLRYHLSAAHVVT